MKNFRLALIALLITALYGADALAFGHAGGGRSYSGGGCVWRSGRGRHEYVAAVVLGQIRSREQRRVWSRAERHTGRSVRDCRA